MNDLVVVALITAVPSTIAAVTGALSALATRATRQEMAVVKAQTNHLAELAVVKSGEAGQASGQYEEAKRQQAIAARLAVETAATAAERSREYEKLVDERSQTEDATKEFWKEGDGPVEVTVVSDEDSPVNVKEVKEK